MRSRAPPTDAPLICHPLRRASTVPPDRCDSCTEGDPFRLAIKDNRVAVSLNAALTLCLVVIGVLVGALDAQAQQKNQRVADNFNIVSMRITNVSDRDGHLFAAGLAAT